MIFRQKRKAKKKIGTRILYWVSHLFCFIFVIFLFLTLVQCTIKKPEAPSWRTNLIIPLANKTWTMSELVEKLDQENLTIDSVGNPMFFYENVLDTVSIDASFSIANINESFADSLGNIDLDPIAPTNFTINLGDEFPDLPLGSFPDTSFDVSQALPPLGDYAVATISNGNMVVTIVNDFNLDLDTVIVTIDDDSLGSQVTQYNIPGGIPEGGTAVDTIDLSGHTISNKLSALIHCHTPGKPTFFVSGDLQLSTGIGMPDGLSVSSAVAAVPRISKDFSDTIAIDCDHQVTRAVLSSGLLNIVINNNTGLPDTISLIIPGLKNNDIALTIDTVIPDRDNIVISQNLSGYTLEPTIDQELIFDAAAIINSSGVLVSIDATDDVAVLVDVQNIEFSLVEGTLASTNANFADIEQDIDIPAGFDAMQLPSAVAFLEITNAVNIPGSFDIDLHHNNGLIKNVTGLVNPGTVDDPAITITQVSIGDFMNPIPEHITVNGNATFGGTGSATPDDYVVAKVTITSPLEFIIGANDSIEGEWENTKLDIDSALVNGFKMARFNATFTNGLPVGVTAEILLAGDSALLYTNPELILGPVSVAAGYINPITGTVDSARVSTNDIVMDSTMLQILHRDTLWIGEWIKLDTTGSQSVKMMSSDFLTITGYIEVDYNFSDDLFED